MKRIISTIAIAAAVVCAASSADARPKHHRHHRAATVQSSDCFLFFCPGNDRAKPGHRRAERAPRERRAVTAAYPRQLLPHPPGCPRRLFCGCGASIRAFGRSIRRLWLAENWLDFPRAAPAPTMAAVRGGRPGRGHVFILEEHVSGSLWRVYDANAGGGRTLRHVRSIAGYRIVNPHGTFASRGSPL